MSEEFVNGCIQHRDTRHLRLYYDYMDIYSDNEYKAKIIRILETWTDHKRTEWYKTNSDRLEQGQEILEPDFWITMSYQQFRQFMRHTASEDTLKKALTELEQAKHIKRRINPDLPYGPPQYLLNTRVIQAALNKLSTPPQVPDLPPQEDTTPPGKNIPPREITPTLGVELPPPRGEEARGGGGENTPTQGGKFGTSNITTKNYLEDVIDSDKEESTGEQTNTTTSASSLPLDALTPSFPSDTHSQQGEYHGHTDDNMADMALDHAEHLPGVPDCRSDRQSQATPEIDLAFCTAETEHRLPAIPKTPSLSPAVEPGRSGGPTPVAPASPPGGTSHEQNRDATAPRSVAVEVDSGCTAPAPTPQVPPGVTPPRTMRATVVPAPPKWDAQAMVARAEALRERPFSESARPKETKAARKLFARKSDLTEEEFTSAFQHWNTPWWRETNGLFCITDLAAVPKNKSEMRLIIALEKLAMPKKPPGGQVIQMPTSRGQQWRSSFDDPDYDMSAEFYPGTVAR